MSVVKNRNTNTLKRIVLSLVFLFSFCYASCFVLAESSDVVVANSQDWRDLYLGTVYAKKIDAKLISSVL